MNLLQLYWRLSLELQRLADSVSTPPLQPLGPCGLPHELGREGAVVQLQDRWSNYVREVILRSAMGGVSRASGVGVPRSGVIRNRHQALVALRATYIGKAKKGAKWEPRWYDPVEAIDAASRLQLVNAPDISAALGSTPNPLPEIRAVRNLIAHRGLRSATSAMNFSVAANTPAIHAHLTGLMLGGIPRFTVWTIQLDGIARAAVN